MALHAELAANRQDVSSEKASRNGDLLWRVCAWGPNRVLGSVAVSAVGETAEVPKYGSEFGC